MLADLDDLWRCPAETWSLRRADYHFDELVQIFETIAAVPTLARKRSEFTAPVRIHLHESRLIVYAVTDHHITVLCLLGGRQDWTSILTAVDL